MPLGITFAPLMALGVPYAVDVGREAEALGYDSFWTAEVTGPEAFSVLGAVGASTGALGLGTGVLALQLRTPPLLAMAAASLQALVGDDREVFVGVGISSPVVAGRWHGAGYGTRPVAQVREFLTVLRSCLSGEKVDFAGDFYAIKGFRLGVRLGDRRPRIVLGALNEQMLRLGGELADGVLLNYLPSTLVPWAVEQIRRGGDATVHAYVHAGVADPAEGEQPARFDLFSYATVDAYARNFERAGYGDAVAEIRERHRAGDREGALAAVSREMIDGIDFTGTEDEVRRFVRAYVDAGVERPVLFPLPWSRDRRATVSRTLEVCAGLGD